MGIGDQREWQGCRGRGRQAGRAIGQESGLQHNRGLEERGRQGHPGGAWQERAGSASYWRRTPDCRVLPGADPGMDSGPEPRMEGDQQGFGRRDGYHPKLGSRWTCSGRSSTPTAGPSSSPTRQPSTWMSTTPTPRSRPRQPPSRKRQNPRRLTTRTVRPTSRKRSRRRLVKRPRNPRARRLPPPAIKRHPRMLCLSQIRQGRKEISRRE